MLTTRPSPTKNYKRYHSDKSAVRVRFAPSPTGFLHLGGLRTALYNFLFAKSQKGSFILRIEDTDQTRAVPGAVEHLTETLHWAGLVPDEGPAQGGDHGPYVQSERIPVYKSYAEDLLASGWAYPCFCTARRLELMRKDAVRRREPSKYDNRCRELPLSTVQGLLAENTPHVIRLKLEPTPDPWDDLVQGPTAHNLEGIEGDPVLIKSDGFPTYHFANVVDDHLMEITHVLRGAEWLSSTPKHILLYKAFGWQPPQFGHLPLILNADGTKLSKRQGDVDVEHYKAEGYFSQAVLHYITSIGGGFHHHSTVGMELPQMCQSFSLDAVRSTPGRLDKTTLQTANRQVLRKCVGSTSDPSQTGQVIAQVRQLVVDTFGERLEQGSLRDEVLSEDYILGVVRWSLVEERVTTIHDLVTPNLMYLWVTPSPSHLGELYDLDPKAELYIADCLDLVKSAEEFSTDFLSCELKLIMKTHKAKAKIYFQVIRLALTGLKQGAPVAEMMSVVGRDQVTHRLDRALNMASHR